MLFQVEAQIATGRSSSVSLTDEHSTGEQMTGRDFRAIMTEGPLTVLGKWADTLTQAEAEFTAEAMRVLRPAQWASALLSRLEQQGGICSGNMPLLFEVRIAYALHRVGVAVTYEQKTGAGQKSADFRVHGEPGWLIEAVRLAESKAVKAATKQRGNLFSLHLSSNAKDGRQSEEGELIKAIERIEVKASKFPPTTASTFHVILIDVRGYLGHGGDHDDYREMAYGTGAAVVQENTHWWNGEPILGLFDARNSRELARLVQRRVHYLGFVKEKKFGDGELQRVGFYLPNLTLFEGDNAAAIAFAKYPLRP